MSDLMDINLDDIQPASLLEDGNYPSTCTYAGAKRGKDSDKPYISVMFVPDDNDESDGFSGMLSVPTQDDEPRAARFKAKGLADFADCMGLDKGELMRSIKEAFDALDGGEEKVRIEFIEGAKGLIKVTSDENDGVVRNVVAKNGWLK